MSFGGMGGFGDTDALRVETQAISTAVDWINRVRKLRGEPLCRTEHLFIQSVDSRATRPATGLIAEDRLCELMTELAKVPEVIEREGMGLVASRDSSFSELVSAIARTSELASEARADIRQVENTIKTALVL